jgi:hypothetical protein
LAGDSRTLGLQGFATREAQHWLGYGKATARQCVGAAKTNLVRTKSLHLESSGDLQCPGEQTCTKKSTTPSRWSLRYSENPSGS